MTRFLLGTACAFALAYGADDRVKVDNDVVRILKVIDPPGSKTALHRHEMNRVMIYLNEGDQTITYDDGHVDRNHWKESQVVWSPGGPMHVSQNVGTAPLGIVEIELKQGPPGTAPRRDPSLDPVAIDEMHNILLFENPQVRVFRSWREAGATEMMHEHTGRGRVVVLLTDIDAKVKAGDGKSSEMQGKAGDVYWTGGAIKHAGTNAGSKKFDMILVEVK